MRLLYPIFICLLVFSCLSESGVEPGNNGTFVRYYNGGNNDEARAMEITANDDGFIIMATTRIQESDVDIPIYKIKLIKTDLQGNPLWEKLYPPVGVDDPSYTAAGLQVVDENTFVIIGNDQTIFEERRLVLMTINADTGDTLRTATIGNHKPSYRAESISLLSSTKNYVVLSQSSVDSMSILEIDKTTLAPVSNPTSWAAGASTSISRRLIVDNSDKTIWSGGVQKNGLATIRVIRTTPNTLNPDFELLINDPPYVLTSSDIVRYGNDYAIIGSTNKKGEGSSATSGDTDILFMRVSSEGNLLTSQSFPLDNPATTEIEDTQNDKGSSISTTQDGGLILLSAVDSKAIGGRGDLDFYLIKVGPFGGAPIWTSSFGSKFKDEGVAVRQTVDGGFVVFGTTTQGALKILTLLKTDANGKIQ